MAVLDIAVVTVTYNGSHRILQWAEALQQAWSKLSEGDSGRMRILAIDNASSDDTVACLRSRAPWVEVIASPENQGFAAGCNIGLRSVRDSQLVVLLNPDVIVAADFFLVLAQQQWPDDLAAIGPSIRTPGGGIEQSARAFPRASTGLWGRTTLLTRLFPGSASRELRADPAQGRCEVDWISGACMIMPVAALAKVGSLDEGYFMYWEDADWCKRAREDALRIVFEPALEAIHYQGTSSASRPIATTVAFHKSAYRYYRKHVARRTSTRACAAAALGLRCAIKLLVLLLDPKRRS